MLRFKVRTAVVTDVAGAAQGITDDQLSAGVLFPASVSADTEVIGVIKAAPVPCINSAVPPDLFGYGGRILTEILCDRCWETVKRIQKNEAVINRCVKE